MQDTEDQARMWAAYDNHRLIGTYLDRSSAMTRCEEYRLAVCPHSRLDRDWTPADGEDVAEGELGTHFVRQYAARSINGGWPFDQRIVGFSLSTGSVTDLFDTRRSRAS